MIRVKQILIKFDKGMASSLVLRRHFLLTQVELNKAGYRYRQILVMCLSLNRSCEGTNVQT